MKLWKTIIDATDDYAKQSKWTDFSLLKICVGAVGVIIGISIPKQKKKCAFWTSTILYIATIVPLMMKFLPILNHHIEAPNSLHEEE